MRVVMTGGTSGIGFEALKSMLSRGVVNPIVGLRDPSKLPAELKGKIDARVLDLASFDSVRTFAKSIGDEKIDRLILNAGVQAPIDEKSADGYNMTFAVNHLAHFMLMRLLSPNMLRDSRIIFTASGTHDPAAETGMPAPRHTDIQKLAFPDQDPDLDRRKGTAGRRAYSASKLCNVMTVRELAIREAERRVKLCSMAFDPGFVPETRLTRSYPGIVGWVFRNILPKIVKGDGVSTVSLSGRYLADMVLSKAYSEEFGTYWSVREGYLRNIAPSKVARNHVECAALWNGTETFLDLVPEHTVPIFTEMVAR